ncbi:hypothetical protein [Acetobacterium sp.]|nr:hypothetical protein [Acetobacterium sp.]MDO9493764.1 hypothetical protein [Acetobacterium sp.]
MSNYETPEYAVVEKDGEKSCPNYHQKSKPFAEDVGKTRGCMRI